MGVMMARSVRTSKLFVASALPLVILLTACVAGGAPAGQTTGPSAAGASTPNAPSKRVVAAIMGYPRTVRNTINAAGGAGEAPGLDIVQELLHVGMVTTEPSGQLAPRLANAVPSIPNGLWTVGP